MFEVDYLPVGDGTQSGDAITMRFPRADVDALAHVIIDGGFQSAGEKVVNHVVTRYGTDHIDIVILTHPDGDHIGGLGTVIRELNVDYLLTHRPALHGHPGLDASKAVEDLVSVAKQNGTEVVEPFAGTHAFGKALVIAGPTEAYYEQLLNEQALTQKAASQGSTSLSAARAAWMRLRRKLLSALPVEIPFDDAGGTNPRNNTSVVTDVRFGTGRRLLFTGDAGVPALQAAADYLAGASRADIRPTLFDAPHHGSRHNLDSATLTRFLGDPNQGSTQVRTGVISIAKTRAEDPRYPSPRVANGLMRRGCRVAQTAGVGFWLHGDGAPSRADYVPATYLEPQDESIDDRP